MRNSIGYWILLVLSLLITIAGIATLIPYEGASKVNMIGYRSHCTFAPVSSILCFILGGINCRIRKKLYVG
jgi:hypothetical protein